MPATRKAAQGKAAVPSPVPVPQQEAVPVGKASQDRRVPDLEAAVDALTVRVAKLEATAAAPM